MKNQHLSKCLVICALLLLTKVGLAQINVTKPTAFHLQPATISVSEQMLNAVINNTTGSTVNLPITSTFHLVGNVHSVQEPYSNLKTVIVKLTNYPNVLLSISKIAEENKPIKYVGRLISNQYSDAYELQFTNGVYQLEKKITEHLIPTCH